MVDKNHILSKDQPLDEKYKTNLFDTHISNEFELISEIDDDIFDNVKNKNEE
jgi:hypothetical protein